MYIRVYDIDAASPLLLNVCIVFMGTLVLEFLLPVVKSRVVKDIFVDMTLVIELLLCMSFPFTEFNGFTFDLRAVPLIIAALYGNNRTCVTMSAVFLVYRFMIGGSGALPAVVLGLALVAIACFLRKSYKHRSRMTKIGLASLPMFLALAALHVVLIDEHILAKKTFPTLLMFDVVNVIVLWATLLAIEYVIENFKLREEVYRAEKYQVLGELAASIAHEIRNPMTTSRGFLQLAMQSNRVEQEYLQTAVSELDRAHQIINDYLSFARPNFETNVLVEIEEQVRHAAEILMPYSHLNNVSVNVQLTSGLQVHGDPKKITQMFVNMMKNAIEAMPEGGELTVQSEKVKRWVQVHIKDTGVGMKEEELKRIGNPFYSNKANGTGLGLMTTYRICQAIGGKIEVTSAPNLGTEFTISIPLAQVEARKAAEEGNEVP